MRRVPGLSSVVVLALALAIVIPNAWASSVDEHISALKSDDPAVRAKAAYELGCT